MVYFLCLNVLGKMAKREVTREEHKGYINFVSPKKKKGPVTHFDVQLQNSPTTPIKVKMFGEKNFRTAEQYHNLKSPVKMRLTWSEKYSNYQLDDRESIHKCNNMEVDFPQNLSLPGSSQAVEGESVSVTVAELQEMPLNNNKYYNAKGTLVLGKQNPFQLNNTVVKDDVMLVDTSGHIRVKVWGKIAIGLLVNKASYSLTRLKVRKDRENYMTTTPISEITQIPPLRINLPSSQNFFPTQIEVLVPKVKRLGRIDRFFSCGNSLCRKKMENVFASSQGAVQCNHCDDWFMKDDLSETIMTRIAFNIDGTDTELAANKDVLSTVVQDWSEDVKIATSLLSMKNICVTYSAISKMILELKLESYEDLFEDEMSIELDNRNKVDLVNNQDKERPKQHGDQEPINNGNNEQDHKADSVNNEDQEVDNQE